jgi:TatD DNase family protein
MSKHTEAGDLLVYQLRNSLYVNLTSRCTAHCVFCRREAFPVAGGYDLGLEREHTVPEFLEAIGDPCRYREVVFCGFGEPTIRLAELVDIARALKRSGVYLRLNTNGHGNLIHKENIVPKLAGLLDEVSISINAPESQAYSKIVRPEFGEPTFGAVIDFTIACRECIPRVVLTAVDLPSIDLEACRLLAEQLGVEFRARPYEEVVGSLAKYEGS